VQPVVIYTLRGCPYCVRARRLFETKRIPFREIDVSGDWTARMRISDQTGHRTFPQIFIGETFVGGCDEVHSLERAGKLDPMLA
jgi:glutaredoxin 3